MKLNLCFPFFPNFIITGWRDSILSLPKKWLSVSGATDEFGFPEVSRQEKLNAFEQRDGEREREIKTKRLL